MPQSTDPDVRQYDGQDDVVPCPECHAFMLPLQGYEISKSVEAPVVSAELWEFLLWGWWAFASNYLWGALTLKGRLSKLAQQKAEVLPQFPRSLVCPKCLHIIRRP